jgi:hypothetical protein
VGCFADGLTEDWGVCLQGDLQAIRELISVVSADRFECESVSCAWLWNDSGDSGESRHRHRPFSLALCASLTWPSHPTCYA